MGEWGAKAPLEPALWHFQSQNQELGGPRRLGKRSWQTKRLFRFLGCATPLSPPDLGRCSCAPGNFSKPPDLVSTSSFFRWQLGHPGATLAAPLPLWSPSVPWVLLPPSLEHPAPALSSLVTSFSPTGLCTPRTDLSPVHWSVSSSWDTGVQ